MVDAGLLDVADGESPVSVRDLLGIGHIVEVEVLSGGGLVEELGRSKEVGEVKEVR